MSATKKMWAERFSKFTLTPICKVVKIVCEKIHDIFTSPETYIVTLLCFVIFLLYQLCSLVYRMENPAPQKMYDEHIKDACFVEKVQGIKNWSDYEYRTRKGLPTIQTINNIIEECADIKARVSSDLNDETRELLNLTPRK